MTRQLKQLRVKLTNGSVNAMTATIVGGNTGGVHVVELLGDEWYCDCIGFNSHGHCRHVDFGNNLQTLIDSAAKTLK